MAAYLKSTAYTRTFKMIASSDHLSLKTGASPVVNISKAGAAFGAAAGTVTEIANGWYKVALTTADTGTAGDLSFYITGTAADDTDFVDQVLDPTAANFGVNVVQINAVSTSPVTTVKAVQGLTTADTIATYTGNTPQTGDGFARLGAPAGASVSADVAAVKSDTAAIKTATNTGVAPGAAGGLFIAGTNAATSITTGLTAHLIGTVDTVTTYTGNTPQTGDAYARLGAPAGASVSADVAAVRVDTQLVTTTAQAELAAVPASNATPLAKLNWLFLLARNKLTQTATTQLVKANDGSTTVGTSTVSDDGTTGTRGAFS